MNGLLIGALILSVLISVGVGWYSDEGFVPYAVMFGTCIVLILIVWAVAVLIIQPFNEGKCDRKAEGYELESEWDFRLGCRVYLPTGQLVPIDAIRITSDGRITVDEEG